MKLSKLKLIQAIRNRFSREKTKEEIEEVVPVKIRKIGLEKKLDRLRNICLHTKRFRIKKKLSKRIVRLENEKLVQIRRM